MRTKRIFAILLFGVLLILVACAGPAATTVPDPTPSLGQATTSAPAPVPTPAPVITTSPVPSAPVLVSVPAPAPAAGPSALTFSNLKITPSKVNVGGTTVAATVTVTVTNTGGQEGIFPVVLDYLGDNDECPALPPVIQRVTLAGGASKDVDFPVTLDADFASRYTLMIGQLSGKLVK